MAVKMKTLLVLAASLAICFGDHYHPSSERASSPVRNSGEASAAFWYEEAQAAISRRALSYQNVKTAKNVIMFLGDGMSIPTLAAARTLLGQRRGQTGEEAQLSFEAFPTVGLSKTYCVNHQIADSACSATAYLCGVKNNYGAIGVSAAVPYRNCTASMDKSTHVPSIAAWALEDGRDAGLVTTTRVTHASPSGVYAHTASRNWENDAEMVADGVDPNQCSDIAYQLIHGYPGNQLKVILGGGRRNFLPTNVVDQEGSAGRRTDGRNLIDEWQQAKTAQNASNAYVWHRQQLLNTSEDVDYLLGLFESTHLQYHLEGPEDSEPTLAEMTVAAIKRLQRNERGYFLFVEGGRIDHAHHDNFVHLALDETIELSEAVAQARQITNEDDTLIVVTSDHAHVMEFNGYTRRGGDILGVSDQKGSDGVPYLTLSYANGPGARTHQQGVRTDFTTETNFVNGALRWHAHVEVPLSSETHGGDDVAVFALGPQQHLFSGVYEQSQIPHLMAYAACIGPGQHACANAATSSTISLTAVFLIITTMLARVL